MSGQAAGAGRWAVVGLGPVGRRIGELVLGAGIEARGYDIVPGRPTPLPAADALAGAVSGSAVVVAAVPARAAADVAAAVAELVGPDTLYLDWTSCSREAKAALAERLGEGQLVDVALMDSITEPGAAVCVAGARADEAGAHLGALGFDVWSAGERAGDAAAVKMLRSLFMKPLEALIVEWLRVCEREDPQRLALRSVDRSLGGAFRPLADMLVRTNRIHAARRAHELQDAIDAIDPASGRALLEAARDVLADLARSWQHDDAPESEEARQLVAFLAAQDGRA